MSRKRKKRGDPDDSDGSEAAPRYRIKESTNDQHSSVICKLSRILRVSELLPQIKRLCVVMKQIQLEGWHLANLHVLRCLEEGDEVPEIEQMMFYRCCSAVKANPPSFDAKYPTFHITCCRYWAGRARVPTYDAETLVNGSRMINEMAQLMSTNALNMIALNFRRRLHQYERFRYAPKGKLQRTYRQTKKLVDSCYRVRTAPELDEEGNPTGNTVKLWTEWNSTEDPIELEVRKWLGIVPWQWQIRENSAHFVHKLHVMLVFMEKFVDSHPKTKGAKLYSILPMARTYQAIYIKLNASTFHGLFAQVIDDPKIQAFLGSELNMGPAREKRVKQLTFSEKAFQKNKSLVTRAVFDVAQFESEKRQFVDEIKSNGYAASVTMKRPVTTRSVVVVATKAKKKKKKKCDGATEPRKPTPPTPEELTPKDSFSKELFKLGSDYTPEVLIGIDPGMRNLVTAVTVGRLRSRKRRRRGRRTPRRLRRQRRENCHERVTQISTREYRHMARMKDFQAYHENLKKREPWYRGRLRAMPSFKTASYKTYFSSLQERVSKWRFTRDHAKMKAVDALAARLVPKPSKQVCIAYGDWSRRDGVKGHPTGPVKGFVKALKKRATVVLMDEYRTSIMCSCCHQRLKQARLFTKVKRKEDEEDIRTKANPSKKEMKEIAEMQKFRSPKLADKKIVFKCTRNVIRCVNSRCRANFWDRDVNAARNMLELLRSGLKGKHGAKRLRAFRRGQ